MDNLVSNLKPVVKQAAAGYASRQATAKGKPNLAALIGPAVPVALELATGMVGKKVSLAGDNPIAIEASHNNTADLEALLEKDPLADRVPAIIAAAAKGKISTLDVLLNTPNAPRSNKYHHKHSNIVEPDTQRAWLNSYSKGKTALLAAVEHKHARTTKFLLESGADPNVSQRREPTALHIAARADELTIVRHLVSYGADVNRKDSAGDTPLIIASRWALTDIADCLVQNGADLDATNAKGGTALLVAARHDCVDIIKILVRAGADVKAQDKKGQSVLHRAVEGKYLVEQVPARVKNEMLEILLSAGADPRLKDNYGRTASQTVSWMEGGSTVRTILEAKDRKKNRGRQYPRTKLRRSSF